MQCERLILTCNFHESLSGVENAPGDDQNHILFMTNEIELQMRFFVKLFISLLSPHLIVMHAAAAEFQKRAAPKRRPRVFE